MRKMVKENLRTKKWRLFFDYRERLKPLVEMLKTNRTIHFQI